MIKSVKTIVLLSISVLFIIAQSCLSYEDPDVRTKDTETGELILAVQKLEATGYDIDTTSSGLLYVIHTQGTGEFPQAGDTCYVEYATYFIDGVLLDASVKYFTDGIWEMVYKAEPTIAGFNEGLSLMNKGTEADFIMPSELAYGPLGANGVPGYTPLIFSIKLHDLKPKAE